MLSNRRQTVLECTDKILGLISWNGKEILLK